MEIWNAPDKRDDGTPITPRYVVKRSYCFRYLGLCRVLGSISHESFMRDSWVLQYLTQNFAHARFVVTAYAAGYRDIDTQCVHEVALEEISHGSLFDWMMMQNKVCSEAEAWSLFVFMLGSLKHLHDCRIGHLDVSLENFLLDSQNIVLLTDFGLCRSFSLATNGVEQPHRVENFPGKSNYKVRVCFSSSHVFIACACMYPAPHPPTTTPPPPPSPLHHHPHLPLLRPRSCTQATEA